MRKMHPLAVWTSLLLLFALCAGCGQKVIEVQSVDIENHFRESQGGVKPTSVPTPSSVTPSRDDSQPAYPIRIPARTLLVWVPPHVNNSGAATLGHWIVMVVEPERFDVPGYRRETGGDFAGALPLPKVRDEQRKEAIEKTGADTPVLPKGRR
jgi:hypothetical protein